MGRCDDVGRCRREQIVPPVLGRRERGKRACGGAFPVFALPAWAALNKGLSSKFCLWSVRVHTPRFRVPDIGPPDLEGSNQCLGFLAQYTHNL